MLGAPAAAKVLDLHDLQSDANSLAPDSQICLADDKGQHAIALRKVRPALLGAASHDTSLRQRSLG